MDDATKLAAAAAHSDQEPDTSKRDTSASFVAYMNEPAKQADRSGSEQQENLTTSARALDRWFKERQKNQGAPRLLDVPNEALVSNGGPIQLTGNITLVREDGTVQYANHLALCRCGSSNSKPICDGKHLEREFLNPGKITQASEIPASSRPSKITISCIKDGPITFRTDGSSEVLTVVSQYQGGTPVSIWPPRLAVAQIVYPSPPYRNR